MPCALLPDRRGGMALGTHGESRETAERALGATLVEQLPASAALPVRPTVQTGLRRRDSSGLGEEEAHGRSRPRSRTSQNRAPAPPFEHRATSAPATWLEAQVPRSCSVARMTRCNCCALIAGVAERHGPAIGRHGEGAPRPDVAVLDEGPTLAGPAEAEGLELSDDLERERVVQLGHVDVGRCQAGAAKARRAARAPTSPAGKESAPGLEVPDGGDDVGGSEGIAGPAEDPHGGRAARTGAFRPGQHNGAAALRRRGAVEEMERVGDHAGGEDVGGSERPSSRVHGIGVGVPVGPDHCGDGGHLLGRGAVGQHVPPSHEREFGCGEQPVAHHELVGRTGPGCRRRRSRWTPAPPAAISTTLHCPVVMRAAASRSGRNAHGAGPPGAGSEAQLEGDLRAVGPHHSVDLVGLHAGIGQRPERTEQGDGRRIVVRQSPGLHRVGDAGDGDVTEGVGRHGAYSRTRTRWMRSAVCTLCWTTRPASVRSGTGGRRRAPGAQGVWEIVNRALLSRTAQASRRVRPRCC